jgi:hypothetical protein
MPDEIPLPLLRWACGCLRGGADGVSVLLHIRIHVNMGCRMRRPRQMLRIRLYMYGLARDAQNKTIYVWLGQRWFDKQ